MPPELPLTLSKGANARLMDLRADLATLDVLLTVADVGGEPVNLDVSVLLLQENEMVRDSDDFVFYNQPVGARGAVHLRDRLRDEGRAASIDCINLDLDGLPPTISKVLVVGSLDADGEQCFADLNTVEASVQDSRDDRVLVKFPVLTEGPEKAVIFAEFYLRQGDWRLRSVAQGYTTGLAELIEGFGVDVAEPETSDGGSTPATVSPDEARSLQEDIAELPSAPATGVSVTRADRPPQLPADWNLSVPETGVNDYQAARLFPVAGIGSKDEQERRATSILLALLPLVPELAQRVVVPFGAPSGAVETFIEVPFRHDGRAYRPDGLIRAPKAQGAWQALVEVKTSGAHLSTDQVATYVDIARNKGFDAVITLTNHIADPNGEHPAGVDRRKLRMVTLHHLSWAEITTEAHLLLAGRGLEPVKRRLLTEYIRYAEHARSGLHGFDDMGPRWPALRNSVKNRTMRPGDQGVTEVVANFDELIRQQALDLSGLLNSRIRASVPRTSQDRMNRLQHLSDTGLLHGALHIPGAVDTVLVTLDMRSDLVAVSIKVPAPTEGRPLTQINWLLRQISETTANLRVETGAGGRSWTAEPLELLRDDPRALIPAGDQEIRHFVVSASAPMGMKHAASPKSLTSSVSSLVQQFYGDVVQNLRLPR